MPQRRTNPDPNNWDQVFRHNLRRLRHVRDLSQRELAKSAGLTRAYIGRIETQGKNVQLETIVSLANVLGVEPYELLQPNQTWDSRVQDDDDDIGGFWD